MTGKTRIYAIEPAVPSVFVPDHSAAMPTSPIRVQGIPLEWLSPESPYHTEAQQILADNGDKLLEQMRLGEQSLDQAEKYEPPRSFSDSQDK